MVLGTQHVDEVLLAGEDVAVPRGLVKYRSPELSRCPYIRVLKELATWVVREPCMIYVYIYIYILIFTRADTYM